VSGVAAVWRPTRQMRRLPDMAHNLGS
jgi:hypothetical protein